VGVDPSCQGFLTKNHLIKEFQDIVSERIMRRKTCFLSIIVLFVLLALPLIVQAGASSTMWIQTYGGDGYDRAEAVIQTSDGGYAIAGLTRPGVGEGDFLLIKTDPSGDMEWSNTYGSQDKDEGHVVVQTSDGGYVLAGLMWNRSGGDAGLVKTDSAGNMQWKRNYGEGIAWAMALTNDGGYIMACNSLVKIDSEGKIQWNQPSVYGSVNCVIQTSDDGYALVGEHLIVADNDLSDIDAWLIKTDSEGNIPEFPSWTIVLLVVATTLIAIYFKKRISISS